MAKEKSKVLSALKYAVCFLFVFTFVVAAAVTTTTVGDTKVEAYSVSTPFGSLRDFDNLGSNSLYCVIVHSTTTRYVYSHFSGKYSTHAEHAGDGNYNRAQLKAERFYSWKSDAPDGKHNQQLEHVMWKMTRNSDGTFSFQNPKSGYWLGRENKTDNSTLVINYTDGPSSTPRVKWKLAKINTNADDKANGAYYIKTSGNENSINLHSDASNIHLYNSTNNGYNGWFILPLLQSHDSGALGYVANGADGFTSTLSFAGNVKDAKGLNLTAPDADKANNFTAPALSEANGNENQLFTFTYRCNSTSYGVWDIYSHSRKAYVNVTSGDLGAEVTFGSYNKHFSTYHIVYNMNATNPGYHIISVTSYKGDENANYGQYTSASSKHGFRCFDLNGGKVGGNLKLWDCALYDGAGARIWYFQPPVKVKVVDEFNDGKKTAVTRTNIPIAFNSKYSEYSCDEYVGKYDGYHIATPSATVIDSNTTEIKNKFDPNKCTITYDAPDKTSGSMGTTTHTYNDDDTLNANGFEKKYTVTLEMGAMYDPTVDPTTITYEYTHIGWKDLDGKPFSDTNLKNLLKDQHGSTLTLRADWSCETIDLKALKDGIFGWSEDYGYGFTSASQCITSLYEVTENKTLYAYWARVDFEGWMDGIPDDGLSAFAYLYHTDAEYNENKYDFGVTYDLYRINSDGKKFIDTIQGGNGEGISYKATEADKGHAIKCVAKINWGGESFEMPIVSALCVGDTLVDTDVIGDDNKEVYYDGAILKDGGTIGESWDYREFEFEAFENGNGIASQVIFGHAFVGADYTYRVYGYLDEDKVLLFTNLDYVANRDGVFASSKDSKIGKEGIAFDRYVVEITNKSETNAITVSKNDITLLCLPNVYKLENLDNEKGYTPYYHFGDGEIDFEGCRTEQDGVQYFYKGDIIRIFVPVTNGNKLTAGSHIVINGEKVFPTHSRPVQYNGGEYYVIFDYTNYYECLVRGEGMLDEELNKIMISDKAPADITISVKVDQKANDEIHGLNFGPLGAKTNTKDIEIKHIRFGSVWYFDDYATQKSWSREEAKGTYIIQLKNILKNPETNDFYKYLMEKDPAFVAKWMSKTDEDRYVVGDIVTDEGVKLITAYLKAFINDWNADRKTSSTTDEKGQKIEGKADMMSFGGAEIKSEAVKYYYKTDKNGNTFLEYSAILAIPEKYQDRQLIYIPYASFVADWDHGYLAPNNDKYAANIYLYRAPEAVYTYTDLAKITQAK